jgi:hypothetical protein
MFECALSSDIVLFLKASLHYGDYFSKLVPFDEQKNIFLDFKKVQA